jgi:hypothetical protein
MSTTSATTTRLPDALKLEGDAYAQRLGISLNALIAVALRDYLDQRSGKVSPAVSPTVQAGGFKPPKGPRDKCPCGSGHQYRHCHGKPSS